MFPVVLKWAENSSTPQSATLKNFFVYYASDLHRSASPIPILRCYATEFASNLLWRKPHRAVYVKIQQLCLFIVRQQDRQVLWLHHCRAVFTPICLHLNRRCGKNVCISSSARPKMEVVSSMSNQVSLSLTEICNYFLAVKLSLKWLCVCSLPSGLSSTYTDSLMQRPRSESRPTVCVLCCVSSPISLLLSYLSISVWFVMMAHLSSKREF